MNSTNDDSFGIIQLGNDNPFEAITPLLVHFIWHCLVTSTLHPSTLSSDGRRQRAIPATHNYAI